MRFEAFRQQAGDGSRHLVHHGDTENTEILNSIFLGVLCVFVVQFPYRS